MDKVVVEHVVAEVVAHFSAVRGEPARSGLAGQVRQFVRARLSDPAAYHAYTVRNGKVVSYVQAFRAPQPAGEIGVVHPWLIQEDDIDDARIGAEVDALRRHLALGRRRINVILFPEQRRLREALLAHGLRLDSYELVGRVDDGLATLRRRAARLDLSGYTLAPLDLRRDLGAVLRLDRLSHQADPTSRAHGLPAREQRLEMTSYFKEAATKGHVITLRHERALVGVVGVTFFPRQPRTALLGTITVHPEHQGRGLATCLYHEALLAMKASGARWYHGFSATERVLALAKRMQRRVAHVVLTDAGR